MTWSIIARDAKSGKFGIAVATRFFAVGALVPHLQAGVGAVATQALVNPFFGVNGLALLRAGNSAAENLCDDSVQIVSPAPSRIVQSAWGMDTVCSVSERSPNYGLAQTDFLRTWLRSAYDESLTLSDRTVVEPSTRQMAAVGRYLVNDYFGMRVFESDDGVDFQIAYGEWVRLFRENGLLIEDLLETRPSWAVPQPGRTMLELQPLPEPHAQELVALLGTDRLSEQAQARIVETGARAVATGNPGCLMQIARGARERGLDLEVVHPVTLLARALRWEER